MNSRNRPRVSRAISHTCRYVGQTPGRLLCVITPSDFEGFFEEIGALNPQQQQDNPRVMEIAKKFGLEIPPLPGAHPMQPSPTAATSKLPFPSRRFFIFESFLFCLVQP